MRAEGHRARHQPQQGLAQLVRIERGKAETRHEILLDECADEPREVDRRLEIPTVAAEVHARQHDLLEAPGGERLHLGQHLARREAPARPARHRDDAEGAEEVAALLHLQEGPRLLAEGPGAGGGDAPLAPGLPDHHPRDLRRPQHGRHEVLQTVQADHVVHRRKRPRLRGPGLCVAAGQDDSRRRLLAARAAREPSALGVGGVGHRTRVDDDDVGGRVGRYDLAPRGAQPVGDGGRVVGVHLAPERAEGDPRRDHHAVPPTADSIHPPPRTKSPW